MSAEQVVYPDTGLPAWWCICAANDCEAQAFGPFRTREAAQLEAERGASKKYGNCGNAHFTSVTFGPQMQLRLPCASATAYDIIADWYPLVDEIQALRETL